MTGWHIPEDLWAGYQAGQLDPARVMSLEAHLERCPDCRRAAPVDESWLAGSWGEIVATVARPRQTWPERLLVGLGVREQVARLLAVTPALSLAWFTAVAAVLTFTVTFAYATAGTVLDHLGLLPFLLVAPALPVVGTALAYGSRVDPAHELIAATPMAGARLLLLRTVAVLVAALAPAGLVTPLLPGPPMVGAAWLLPALALTTGCLALATRLSLPLAAGGLATAWVLGVLLTVGISGQQLLAFQPLAQLGYASAAVLCVLVVCLRLPYLDPGGPRWSPRGNSLSRPVG